MNPQEHAFLLAERSTLQRLLKETPRDAVLDRWGLEAKLEGVQERLAAAGASPAEAAESRLTFRGEFLGVLPDGREFEFRLAEGDQVLCGKLGAAIDDPDVINRHLHQPVTIDVLATPLGARQPRYTLNVLPNWQD